MSQLCELVITFGLYMAVKYTFTARRKGGSHLSQSAATNFEFQNSSTFCHATNDRQLGTTESIAIPVRMNQIAYAYYILLTQSELIFRQSNLALVSSSVPLLTNLKSKKQKRKSNTLQANKKPKTPTKAHSSCISKTFASPVSQSS